jgi:hypothetical protein
MKALAVAGQGLTWAALATLLGLFGQGPSFSPYDPGQALIKLSMAHLSERLEPCRQLSAAERAELPPTRRVSEVCGRERAPTRFELMLDEELLVAEAVEPAGLSNGGRSYYLKYHPVEPGRYTVTVRLADTPRTAGFDLERELNLDLKAGESALIEIGDDGVSLGGVETEESS